MNQTEFHQAVRELLIDTWGEKAYPQAHVARLWRIVKGISVGELRQAVDDLGMTCIKAPSLGQIRGACMPFIRAASVRVKDERIAALGQGDSRCQWCAATGLINAIPFDDPTTDVAFICPYCRAASVRGFKPQRGLREWGDDAALAYFPRKHTADAANEHARLQREAIAAVAKKTGATRLGRERAGSISMLTTAIESKYGREGSTCKEN